jgi:hypothetical protein
LFLTGLFLTSCIFGISIAIYPNWWRKNNKNHAIDTQRVKTKRFFHGHHPDCIMFKSHVIIIKNKPRCAGCLGLFIGALLSIFLMMLYLVSPFKIPIIFYYILILIAIFVLIFVYIEIVLLKRHVFFHILLNIFLILSFFLITICVVELTENLIYSTLTILLCFLWLDTRIHLSKYKHQKICANCKQSCKSY